MKEKDTRIDSYLLIKKISSFFLMVTTGCGAFYIGYAQFESPIGSVFAGIFAAIVAVLSIDVMLGAVMYDLFDKARSNAWKWMLMFFLLIMSGGATAFFAYVIGEKIGAPKPIEAKQEIRSSVADSYGNLIDANQQNAAQLKKDIRGITYQFKKDTASIIASMPENHRRLYRMGLHARYMRRSGYATLKENVGRIDTRVNQYLTDIDAKKSALSTIETGLAKKLSSDPLETINGELAAADARSKKEGDMFKGTGWVIDAGLALSLLFSFLFARNMIASDPTIEIPKNELHGWILDRMKNLGKKLLDSTDVADADLQYFVSNVVKAGSSFAGLLGWVAGVFSVIVSTPRRISEQNGFTKFEAVTNDSSPSSPDQSLSYSPARAEIGFHRQNNPGEKPVNKPGEMLVNKPSEQPVKMGGKNPAKLGATQVSAGERKLVNDPGEQLVNNPGERSKKGAGEQVVNVKVVNGAPVFHHYSTKLGEMKIYTRNEVSRFESKYRKEAEAFEEWIKKNQNTAPIEKVMKKKDQMQDRKKKHAYWLAGLNEMDKKK